MKLDQSYSPVRKDRGACNNEGELGLVHNQLEQIPLEKFAIPFIVGQNLDKTFVRMKNRSLLVLEHTNALEVYRSLSSIFYKSINIDDSFCNNILTVYINPGEPGQSGHAFLGLTCAFCDKGFPYNRTFGLYPRGRVEALDILDGVEGVVENEDVYNTGWFKPVKAVFPITHEQALAVMQQKQSKEQNPKYNPFSRNCVDFAMEFAPIIGESSFMDFLPEIQFSRESPPAYQYAVLKYRNGLNEDVVFLGFNVVSLFIMYMGIKIISNLNKLFKKNEDSAKSSIGIEKEVVELIRSASIVAVRVAVGSQHPRVMQATRLVSMVIPVPFIIKEIQSQESLDKNKKPSFSNKKISNSLGLRIGELAALIVFYAIELLKGEEYSQSFYRLALSVSICVGMNFFISNAIKNFCQDITEAPCLDGVDLR